MKIITAFHARLSKIGFQETWNIQGWRSWFIRTVTILSIFIFPIAMGPTLFVLFAEGRYGLISFVFGVWLLFIFWVFFETERSYHIKSILWLAIIYLITVTLFVELGPHYARPGWLITCVVMATLLYGVRGTVVTTAVNAGILTLLYWVMSPQHPAWAAVFNTPLNTWIMFVVNISFICIVTGLAVGFMLDWLDRSLKQKQESEEKYRLLAENVTDVIWTFNLESMRFTYISPSVFQMRGYTPKEAMELTLEQTISPESLEQVIRIMEEELAKENEQGIDPKRSRTLELQQLSKDGTYRWVEVTTSFIRNAEGQPFEILGVTRDITERKRAEEALQALSSHQVALLAAIPDIIMEVDSNKVYTWANQIGLDFFGDEVVGKEAAYYFEGEQDTYEVVDTLFRGRKEVIYVRSWQRRRDGQKRLLDWLFRVLRDPAGNVIGAISSARDITERMQAEEEKGILQERLLRAEKMESLGLLAGGVAHDLNNVLGIVVGYSEMLLMGADKSNPIRSKLVNIMEGGQKAATIVGDLLTLARRGVSGRDVLNLNKIIADWQQSPEFEKLSSYHSAIKIKTDLDPDLLNISGSSVHLGKTIFNLVSNASEAMSKGGVLTIKTANQYLDKPIHGYDKIQEGAYAVLSVSDTGEGIHATDMKRIFEPFYTKKVMGRSGTGLGLAVVWGTVKDHNGYINVHSEEGKGSTFTLYFPVTMEKLPAEHLAVSISEYMGKGESILIVDDVKGQRDLAEEMLIKLNYCVSSASSGEEAVAYLKEHKVDLMVLDMIMDPGIDGLDTYRSVLEICPQQKAIIVSGFSETERVHAAQALGAGTYVRKPYVIEKLGLAVRKEFDKT